MTYKELENLVDDLNDELGKLNRAIIELNGTKGVDLAPTNSAHPLYTIRAGSGIAGRLAEHLVLEAEKVSNRLNVILNHKNHIDNLIDATLNL